MTAPKPITHRIEDDALVLTLRGEYGVTEWREALDEAADDPAFVPGMVVLMDCRAATINPPTSEIRQAVDVFVQRKHLFGGVQVVVASALHYGLTRIAVTLATLAGVPADVHRDMDSAWRAISRRKAG